MTEDFLTDATQAAGQDPALRRCTVTGSMRPREELIRFVLDESGRVWPDLAEKLSGRGLWVGCDTELLQTAIRKNHFAKAMRGQARIEAGLLEAVETQLVRRLQDALGLARRSGAVITGFAQIEPAARAGQLAVILIARDAGDDGQRKLKNLISPEKILMPLMAAEQGAALGSENLVYLGLNRKHLQEKLLRRILLDANRLLSFIAKDKTKEKIASTPALAQIGDEFWEKGDDRI
jgi:uncharacterized protein